MCFLVMTSACRSETAYGECLGIQQNEEKDPTLVYDVSVRNLVVGGFLFWTIAVPAVVLLSDFQCPVKKKTIHLNAVADSG
jgi:hypothetical protein